MGNTPEGARRARDTNMRKYGQDFYVRIGSMGGKASHTGGFYARRDIAREAGRKGGLKSRRGPK
jgi:general stress protein YciG